MYPTHIFQYRFEFHGGIRSSRKHTLLSFCIVPTFQVFLYLLTQVRSEVDIHISERTRIALSEPIAGQAIQCLNRYLCLFKLHTFNNHKPSR